MELTHKEIPAYATKHEADVVGSADNILYGPYQCLSAEDFDYIGQQLGRELSDYEKILYENLNQMDQRVIAYAAVGDKVNADAFRSEVRYAEGKLLCA